MKRKREKESSDLSDTEHMQAFKKHKKSKFKKEKKKKEKKAKKEKKKKSKKEKKHKHEKERSPEKNVDEGRSEVNNKLAPMTKEEWEKQQNQIRRWVSNNSIVQLLLRTPELPSCLPFNLLKFQSHGLFSFF